MSAVNLKISKPTPRRYASLKLSKLSWKPLFNSNIPFNPAWPRISRKILKPGEIESIIFWEFKVCVVGRPKESGGPITNFVSFDEYRVSRARYWVSLWYSRIINPTCQPFKAFISETNWLTDAKALSKPRAPVFWLIPAWI